MIKYVSLPNKRTTIAILEDCEFDAANKIDKMCDNSFGNGVYAGIEISKYIMPNRFKVSVVCSDEDVWDEEEGKRIAKAKLLRNYYASLDKRINRFKREFEKCSQELLAKF